MGVAACLRLWPTHEPDGARDGTLFRPLRESGAR